MIAVLAYVLARVQGEPGMLAKKFGFETSSHPCRSRFPQLLIAVSLFRSGPLSVTDPRGDVRSFVADLDAQFGVTHPPFLIGSYNDVCFLPTFHRTRITLQALNDAKSSLRFLLVYLHSPAHQHSRTFVQSILCSQALIDFVARHNLLLWACSVDKPEGYRGRPCLPFIESRIVIAIYSVDGPEGEQLSLSRVAVHARSSHGDGETFACPMTQ